MLNASNMLRPHCQYKSNQVTEYFDLVQCSQYWTRLEAEDESGSERDVITRSLLPHSWSTHCDAWVLCNSCLRKNKGTTLLTSSSVWYFEIYPELELSTTALSLG
eukprot:767047-Hanusia_phi.AAC.3